MRMALVCGDGLPVSGLLTVFRNVIDLLPESARVDRPIAADLGYSWRPDKTAYFPDGGAAIDHPGWLTVSRRTPVTHPGFAEELTRIRTDVAHAHLLDQAARTDLRARIEPIALAYERYFDQWLREHDVDWLCAINMTISDAVPVTVGLHRAAARRWRNRPGGVLFWDHDLFGSYAVLDGGDRVYPHRPNDFTPVPGIGHGHRWAVVSEGLAREAASYPTPMRPVLVPNVLPSVPDGELEERHHTFMRDLGLDPGRPVILAPVRMFRVKGVEIAVRLLAEARRASQRRGEPPPYLLVFGDPREDPPYADEVMATVATERVEADLRFLGGVPLTSHRPPGGRWRLDEVDLLRVAAATHGGVFFTPNRTDVESVGLGPALAAVAGIPCAVTAFAAYKEVYSERFRTVPVDPAGDLVAEAEQLARRMAAHRAGERWLREESATNRALVARQFPNEPWRALLAGLRQSLGLEDTDRDVVSTRSPW